MFIQFKDVESTSYVFLKLFRIIWFPSSVCSFSSPILYRQLKTEKKFCMEELQCNLVVMKKTQPKVLRLNLVNSPNTESEVGCATFEIETSPGQHKSKFEKWNMIRGPAVTPVSSPDHESPLTITDVGTSSISSSDPGTSPFLLSGISGILKRDLQFTTKEHENLDECDSDTDSERLSSCSTSSYFQPWMSNILSSSSEYSKPMLEGSQRHDGKALTSAYEVLLEKLSKLDQDPHIGLLNYRLDLDLSKSVREAISLSRNLPLGPPPLCSICQHKGPTFGNPPRWFTFAELEFATGGFSQANFLAEGGFGSVHRGVLPDGQVIAVKQHKLASSQGDLEFCSEVEVLSCAQHRNVVMLIGFCVEDGRRLLVYEYICNGSLDSHLYGKISLSLFVFNLPIFNDGNGIVDVNSHSLSCVGEFPVYLRFYVTKFISCF